MPLQLRCTDVSQEGKLKVVDLPQTKPLRVRCRDKEGLEVIMEFRLESPQRCTLLCSGPGKVYMEGTQITEGHLDMGALLEVGKQRIEVSVPTNELPSPSLGRNRVHYQKPCSHCQTLFTTSDCKNGWVDGKFRICTNCLPRVYGLNIYPSGDTLWKLMSMTPLKIVAKRMTLSLRLKKSTAVR